MRNSLYPHVKKSIIKKANSQIDPADFDEALRGVKLVDSGRAFGKINHTTSYVLSIGQLGLKRIWAPAGNEKLEFRQNVPTLAASEWVLG